MLSQNSTIFVPPITFNCFFNILLLTKNSFIYFLSIQRESGIHPLVISIEHVFSLLAFQYTFPKSNLKKKTVH